MKKTDFLYAFWTKVIAFMLTVLIVPAILAYGGATVWRYVDRNFDRGFYESDLCWTAVYNEIHVVHSTAYLLQDHPQMAQDLSAEYAYNAAQTNLRFVLQDDEEAIVYDDHSAGDVYMTELDAGSCTAKIYIDPALEVRDSIYWTSRTYDAMLSTGENGLAVSAALALALVFLLIYFARVSGRKSSEEEAAASWQERIPFDLYLALSVGIATFSAFLFCEVSAEILNYCEPVMFLLGAVCVMFCAALLLGLWMTLCLRIKLHRLWENTIIWKLCRLSLHALKWMWGLLGKTCRSIGSFFRRLPLVWRTALGSCAVSVLILVLTLNDCFEGMFILLLPLIVAACLFSMQLRTLQKGGEALAAGDLGYQIVTRRMYWDLKRHGENLNAIGRGMSIAVEQRLRSERLKTELITNVSHDIKTPLTSIINYVDLLQREHTSEQEREYLGVLARQTQKLKKLTTDLVEMSKASTGNLPCYPSRRNVRELIEQAVGEYAERFAEVRLEPVVTLPEQELFCMADGTQVWRVIDNLLSNVCKYSQSGTRVYIGVTERDGKAEFSFKNISRDPLNINAEELMERFVRGDSARISEGSGLGLNIARSLAELQGGELTVAIDGDLFKVGFTLPIAE